MATIAVPLSKSEQRPTWQRSVRVFTRNRLALVGLVLCVLVVLIAVFANFIAPYDPIAQNARAALQAPSAYDYFGTDRFGRDVFSRVIYAGRTSLLVALTSTALGALLGVTLGLLGGYFGGWLDTITGRVMDVLFAFPALLLAIAIAAMLGPSVRNAVIAIAVVYAPLFGRIVRGSTLSECRKEYVEAARVLGARAPRIVLRHVLPNVISPLIVQATLTFSAAILTEAYLSFLGLGTQPPNPSWGTMLSDGRTYLETAPWLSIFPGIAIMVAVLAFNILGDGVRDLFDPRVRSN